MDFGIFYPGKLTIAPLTTFISENCAREVIAATNSSFYYCSALQAPFTSLQRAQLLST
jgi:hypothetical protein